MLNNVEKKLLLKYVYLGHDVAQEWLFSEKPTEELMSIAHRAFLLLCKNDSKNVHKKRTYLENFPDIFYEDPETGKRYYSYDGYNSRFNELLCLELERIPLEDAEPCPETEEHSERLEYDENIIIKPFSHRYPSGYSGMGVMCLDESKKTIDIKLISGAAPRVDDVILFALADKDVRRMIRDYQQTVKRERPFSIRHSSGMSGRLDFYINYYDEKFFIQTGGKKLLHESQYGKLNDGWRKMSIGDFAELSDYYMQISEIKIDIKNRKKLKKNTNCHYVKTYQNAKARMEVTKLL